MAGQDAKGKSPEDGRDMAVLYDNYDSKERDDGTCLPEMFQDEGGWAGTILIRKGTMVEGSAPL